MKYFRIIISLSLFLLATVASGQSIRKGEGTVNQDRFSYCYMEPDHEVKGVLILLPGWGESPESIFEKTALPRLLAEKGFVTVVPQLHQTLVADEYTIAKISELLAIQSRRYDTKELQLVIGGLSAGGAIALGYAQHVLASATTVKLKGVFAIDAPLDLSRIYRSAENKSRYKCQSKLIRKEGSFIRKYLLRTLHGSPDERPDNYLKLSVFTADAEDGGNANLLKAIPIRLYSEPDLDFVRKTYCDQLQYEDINAFDLERLSRFLVSMGNHQAEYITTKGKGFHCWNILDPVDCANWIIALGEEK